MIDDSKIILFLQAGESGFWTTFFTIISYLGSFLGAILAVVFFILFIRSQFGGMKKNIMNERVNSLEDLKKAEEKHAKKILNLFIFSKAYIITFVVTYLLGVGLNFILKEIILRPRPYEIFANVKCLVNSFGSSMPSGHAVSATIISIFVCYIVLKLCDKKFLKIATIISMLIFIFAVLLSRLYLGVHYVSDLAVGTMMGGLFSFLGLMTFNKLIRIFRVVKK